MKFFTSLLVFCVSFGINQARIETILGEIENHEYIGQKDAQIAAPGAVTVGKKFTFPSLGEPRTHVITGFKKVDETDYAPKFKILSGGIGSTEIVVKITSDFLKPILNSTFYFYGDRA